MFDELTAQVLTEQFENFQFPPEPINLKNEISLEPVRLIADKLVVPTKKEFVDRPRLQKLLTKSLEQYGATLLTGRAGAGKTALAAEYARNFSGLVAWYNIEAADADCGIFYHYLIGSLDFARAKSMKSDLLTDADEFETTHLMENLATLCAEISVKQPLLIVLDNLHNIFDAHWFAEFFNQFLRFSNAETHLLMLSRSLPPLPLWRMRSKQNLGVVEEVALAFTVDETIELFEKHGIKANLARRAHSAAYGRATKLRSLIELSFSNELSSK